MDVNGSTAAFASKLAGSSSFSSSPNVNYVIDAVATTSAWTWIFTVLAVCVVYDQSMFPSAYHNSRDCRVSSPLSACAPSGFDA